MKTLTIILYFTVTIFSYTNIYSQKILSNGKTETCFSKTNFDSVYQYIDNQLKKSNTTFYKYDNYNLYLNETAKIFFKKDGYTLSEITKEMGVVSLVKRKQGNDRILKETNQIFCTLTYKSQTNKIKNDSLTNVMIQMADSVASAQLKKSNDSIETKYLSIKDYVKKISIISDLRAEIYNISYYYKGAIKLPPGYGHFSIHVNSMTKKMEFFPGK